MTIHCSKKGKGQKSRCGIPGAKFLFFLSSLDGLFYRVKASLAHSGRVQEVLDGLLLRLIECRHTLRPEASRNLKTSSTVTCLTLQMSCKFCLGQTGAKKVNLTRMCMRVCSEMVTLTITYCEIYIYPFFIIYV